MKPATPKNHLAAIHIAFKALGLSKDDACALKQAVTGVASAKDMSAQQRRRLLAHLSGLQQRTGAPKRAPVLRSVDDALDARWLKARALWARLAVAGVVNIDTDTAFRHWVVRQTHLEHWRFLNSYQINKVIETLKKWCADKGVPEVAAPGAPQEPKT
jgi:hypothetical protein